MPDNVSMAGWAINWCQKTVAMNTTQNVKEPEYENDLDEVIKVLYDETVNYGLFFRIARNNPALRPFIMAELKIDGLSERLFFTKEFNEQYIDPKRAHVEITLNREETVKSGKLYWPSKSRDFHKKGVHTLVVSTGYKKYGQMDQNPPKWTNTYPIKIKVTDIIY